MNTIFLAFDEAETPIRGASTWETGLAVHADDASVGLGFILRDEHSDAIAGACLTPEQAIEHGLWLARHGARMLRHTNPEALPGAALKLKVELSLIVAETEQNAGAAR